MDPEPQPNQRPTDEASRDTDDATHLDGMSNEQCNACPLSDAAQMLLLEVLERLDREGANMSGFREGFQLALRLDEIAKGGDQ